MSVSELVMASGLADHDQRSAIGIARMALDRPYERSKLADVKRRDDLALALIGALEGVEKDEAIAALAKAREMVNAPYRDESLAGFRKEQAARAKAAVPKAIKKKR